ncbi:hypothetical protein MNEG_7994 [Monoraphidium neglectum]|uniref:Cyclin-like domain-containing protein n=1 Tax=Monoraphidium neglectum TaxID=145388 RepID=A0A0D2M9H7_9CHLO|nr:hypothetical protein MNEG_7994 [Monoraphidium neglectum]KIY99969.1 hypothetical protein MNEG_7994 [Monoraphidium neglectum]|eukprot:XP_013898989.1 hypothetical protein MNEG_7994 [Monoraphidium neglectum]
MAWNFLRDSLNTTLCLRYPPEKIAATAVFLSFQVCRRPLSLSAEPDPSAEEGEAVEAPRTFCDVCSILPKEVLEIGNEITANYIAALRHAPVPQLSPQPAALGRRPVALPNIESSVSGDRWMLQHKAGGGGSGGGGAAVAAGHQRVGVANGGAPPSGASEAAASGAGWRGGGSQGGDDGGAAVAGGGAARRADCGDRERRSRDGIEARAACGPSSWQQRARGGSSGNGGAGGQLPSSGDALGTGRDEGSAGAGLGRGGRGGWGPGGDSSRAGKRPLGAGGWDETGLEPGVKAPRSEGEWHE